MTTNIYESVNFSTKTDEEYLVDFYEEILKMYLPPRYKNTSVGLIPLIDLNKAIKKWREKNVFNEKNLISYYQKSVWRVNDMIESCLNLISIHQFENHKIGFINTSNNQCEIIKAELLNYNNKQCLELLYFIKNYDSLENKVETLIRKGNSIFVSSNANEWFLGILDKRFDFKNEKTRGLSAFVSALINNSDVKKHILLESFTQKGIVEYLNLYYDKNLIKNSSRLSKHT